MHEVDGVGVASQQAAERECRVRGQGRTGQREQNRYFRASCREAQRRPDQQRRTERGFAFQRDEVVEQNAEAEADRLARQPAIEETVGQIGLALRQRRGEVRDQNPVGCEFPGDADQRDLSINQKRTVRPPEQPDQQRKQQIKLHLHGNAPAARNDRIERRGAAPARTGTSTRRPPRRCHWAPRP